MQQTTVFREKESFQSPRLFQGLLKSGTDINIFVREEYKAIGHTT